MSAFSFRSECWMPWSRSDLLMVAGAFMPRFATPTQCCVAERQLNRVAPGARVISPENDVPQFREIIGSIRRHSKNINDPALVT
jgi:hypothetical protein